MKEGNKLNKADREIDELLNSPGQRLVGRIVNNVPDEQLSMAWRSSLNERLIETARQKRSQNRVAWFLRPALGLGLAGALAVMLLVHPNAPTQPSGSGIEAAIVATHRDESNLSDVTGVGLDFLEAKKDASSAPVQSNDWDESDVDGI